MAEPRDRPESPVNAENIRFSLAQLLGAIAVVGAGAYFLGGQFNTGAKIDDLVKRVEQLEKDLQSMKDTK